MKKSGGDRLKYAVYESIRTPLARSPFPNGEGNDTRMPLFSHRQSEYMHMWKKNNDGQSFPCMGKAKRRRLRRKKGSQPRLAALGSPFQGKGLAWTLPPSYGRRCPEGAEVGWGSGMKKSGGDRLKSTIYESTLSTADAVPLPQWGRLRYESTAIPDTKPSRGRRGAVSISHSHISIYP